ncbi:MAG: hypothetical protein HFJ34_04630 [Clostridia bacterium]|nr:hypothetical protein [Clostridia bacterium]
MANTTCLGLYIEEHLIKYAKVSKDHDKLKVEAFGIMFYDKIGEAIEQVIQETYSQKTPISINLSQEMYNYFDMFALLTKNDLQKAIKTEFDSFCSEKGYNPNVFESRYAIVGNQDEKEKIKVIHIAANKIELNKQIQQVDSYKLSNISPISMAIPNLIDIDKHENSIVVNIEDTTTVTTILDEKIYNIDKIEEGSKDFLTKINVKENSYLKSYEICKNTTIYTSEGRELQEEQSAYLEDIMPTLYTIVGKVKNILKNNMDKIKKVYITGTAALINNIDLYFEEYLEDVECEILKPHFIQPTVGDISIKDYIEVNSAISLGIMGVGEGIGGMNFKNQTLADKIPDWLKVEIGGNSPLKDNKNLGGMFTWDLGQPFDRTETGLLRLVIGLILLVVIYSVLSGLLDHQMKRKKAEAEQSISDTNNQITLARTDNEKINSKINEYTNMIKNLEEANNKIAERNKTRNAIPNLLNQIMSIVPENVQLTSIDNTSGTHVVITAQSNKYEQLGYLVAKMKTDVILTNVISTAGQKDNNVVSIRIEGDLP